MVPEAEEILLPEVKAAKPAKKKGEGVVKKAKLVKDDVRPCSFPLFSHLPPSVDNSCPNPSPRPLSLSPFSSHHSHQVVEAIPVPEEAAFVAAPLPKEKPSLLSEVTKKRKLESGSPYPTAGLSTAGLPIVSPTLLNFTSEPMLTSLPSAAQSADAALLLQQALRADSSTTKASFIPAPPQPQGQISSPIYLLGQLNSTTLA